MLLAPARAASAADAVEHRADNGRKPVPGAGGRM